MRHIFPKMIATNMAAAMWIGLIALALTGSASAQDRRQNAPGEFDFYVLSLSWSPSFCASASERGNSGRSQQIQCGGDRPYAFVVHGLWPQYERGFPSECATGHGRLPDRLIRDQLDVFPAPGLVVHEWRSHGTCSGLAPADYFRAARRAFEAVSVPDEFRRLDAPRMVDADAVERAFRAANPGLDADEVAVTCDGRRLREVRVCFTRDLSAFRRCPEIDADQCRRDRVYMPAVRGR